MEVRGLTKRFCWQRGEFWMCFELLVLSEALGGVVIRAAAER
jgi:hypothetical protein